MIILFEENETKFTSLGLGSLKDVETAIVKEKLNDTFELSLTYPVNGKNYEKLKVNRIVYCKANPYDEAQPFRIYSITKPINGMVTVDAVHISYDMNGIPVLALDGKTLQDVLLQIQNKTFDDNNKIIKYALVDNEFTFGTNVTMSRSYKTTMPFNMRAILMGGDDSILNKYDAEVKFDKMHVNIVPKRGENRGAKVLYGHNMTDLNHKTSNETLYNGVFPYYHKETTKTETSTEDKFKQVHIVGAKPFQEDWLSYSEGGEPYHPLDDSPVQIATKGDYYEKVYTWDELYQNYVERIYNETLIVVQGLVEPTWIKIDWSKFPTISCKANKKGYFKKSTDSDWGEIKGVGDVIFEGSIISSGIIENLILNYSEVIPTSGNKENVEVSDIVDVRLDDPIIWLDTQDATNLLHDNVLCIDLSDEFDNDESDDDGPTQEKLRAKAEEYISKNKLGRIKHSTTVSFVDLASTTEADRYQNFDHIELGDTVRVVYRDLGVDVDLRVISTTYDAVNNIYSEIELGEKPEKLTDSSIQTGDNISSLTNDSGFASVTTVHKLIAETVTAEYLEAVNAKLSTAQIKQLEVEKIKATGIIEATQFELDTLISKLLIAENAQISNTLTAGKIKVAGDITLTSGEIQIQNQAGDNYFRVDRDGNLTANAVNITGGELNINDGVFLVQNDGTLFATNAYIEGNITSIEGNIGGFTIKQNCLYSGMESMDDVVHDGIFIGSDPTNGGIALGKGSLKITPDGKVSCNDIQITGGELNINNAFTVDKYGAVECTNISITGVNSSVLLNGVSIDDNGLSMTKGNIQLGYDSTRQNYNFSADDDGTIICYNLQAKIGEISCFEFTQENMTGRVYVQGYGDEYVKLGKFSHWSITHDSYNRRFIDSITGVGIKSDHAEFENELILPLSSEYNIQESGYDYLIRDVYLFNKYGLEYIYRKFNLSVSGSSSNEYRSSSISKTELMNMIVLDDYHPARNESRNAIHMKTHEYLLNANEFKYGAFVFTNSSTERYLILGVIATCGSHTNSTNISAQSQYAAGYNIRNVDNKIYIDVCNRANAQRYVNLTVIYTVYNYDYN